MAFAMTTTATLEDMANIVDGLYDGYARIRGFDATSSNFTVFWDPDTFADTFNSWKVPQLESNADYTKAVARVRKEEKLMDVVRPRAKDIAVHIGHRGEIRRYDYSETKKDNHSILSTRIVNASLLMDAYEGVMVPNPRPTYVLGTWWSRSDWGSDAERQRNNTELRLSDGSRIKASDYYTGWGTFLKTKMADISDRLSGNVCLTAHKIVDKLV